MNHRLVHRALTLLLGCAALFLVSCSTVETRISEHPEIYQRLNATDQALVQQGKIRDGMPQDAVYLAWGPPSQRVPGRNRGRIVETWIYDATTAGDYNGPFLYGYPYGYGLGYGYFGGFRRPFRHAGFFYDPFYDPFFYNHANIVRYPERTVSFENGRVIAYQFLPAPRIF